MRRPNDPHILLVQRFALLMVIVGIAAFFASRGMLLICLALIPLLYLLSQSAYPDNPNKCFQNINNPQAIQSILDSLPVASGEPSNYVSKLFSLIWPYIFAQERVDQFKQQLQSALDQSLGNWMVRIDTLELGDRAPQIIQMKTPDKPLPAASAILYQIEMLYYPDYRLSCTVSGPAVPSFRISFTDLTIKMEVLLQYETAEGPFIEGVPYITGIAFTLLSPPVLVDKALQVTLFSGSNILNRDFIKKAIGDAIRTAAWNVAGMPNGCALERVGGSWKVMQVISDDRMVRASLSRGELLRYSRLKRGAAKLCEDLKIPHPLTIQTLSYRDVSVSGKSFEILSRLEQNLTVESVAATSGMLAGEVLSPGELRWFAEMTLAFMENAFKELVEGCTQRHCRPDDMTTAAYYGYLNDLRQHGQSNREMWDTLRLEARASRLAETMFAAQKKLGNLPVR